MPGQLFLRSKPVGESLIREPAARGVVVPGGDSTPADAAPGGLVELLPGRHRLHAPGIIKRVFHWVWAAVIGTCDACTVSIVRTDTLLGSFIKVTFPRSSRKSHTAQNL